MVAVFYDHSAWKLPLASIRSKVWAPKKSRWASHKVAANFTCGSEPCSRVPWSRAYMIAVFYDHSAWKLPLASIRSKVWAPKKSRWAWSRLAGRRAER
jgi:hypothetical protein